jgi:hypothetical protein
MDLVPRLFVLLLAALAVGCGEHKIVTSTELGQRRSGALSDQLAFRLLRGPADPLPERVRSQLARNLQRGSRDEFVPTHIHRVHTAAGAIWVFIDGSAVCLAQGTRGAVACTDSDHANFEGVTLVTFTPPSSRVPRPHDFFVMGLLPDQVGEVEVNIGKRHQTLTVRRNLFFATSNRPILITRLVHSSVSRR